MHRCFSLQKYTGINSRYTCPNCGRKRCFTLYVDEDGQQLSEQVGRCDHESSCGYHYKPREYFRDHPEIDGSDWRDAPLVRTTVAAIHRLPEAPKTLFTIPEEIVARSVRPAIHSTFTIFLSHLFDDSTVLSLVTRYKLGVTRAGDVIFFQIDAKGRCRTGKIMKYNPDTGHRIKDPDTKGRISWVHALMKYANALPQDWQLTQCLFGEHLLSLHPDATIALVESEKTAVIASAMMPEYLWLATGGKSQFNDRLSILLGRDIIAFPDVDGYDTWVQKASNLPNLNIKVSNILQLHATFEEQQQHIDIADWLIRTKLHPQPPINHSQPSTLQPNATRINTTFLRAARHISPEYHQELLALIEDLCLEMW